jgi:hypothetical protein
MAGMAAMAGMAGMAGMAAMAGMAGMAGMVAWLPRSDLEPSFLQPSGLELSFLVCS